MQQITEQLAKELGVRIQQVQTTIELMDQGNTVPFIARYRKEATGGLDDNQLRELDSRLAYLRSLEERRLVILDTIEEQGKLTDTLKQQILEADSKTRLEDLYLPYKPKRRTKGEIARQAGLEPLAERLLGDPSLNPEQLAREYHNSEHGFNDVKSVLDGARAILMERFAQNAALLAEMRNYIWQNAHVCASLIEGKEQDGAKFRDYFNHREPLAKAPSHRVLALLRGRNEGILNLGLDLGEEQSLDEPCEAMIARHEGLKFANRPADIWLQSVVRWSWKVKLSLQMQNELFTQLREGAEQQAIHIFANNLHDLLMAAPAGPKVIMGLDPGYRTGVKVAVIDITGKLLTHSTIYPFEPQKQYDRSLHTLGKLCRAHSVELISIGNGTASRETDQLVADLIKQQQDPKLSKIVVSEAGASVYSASQLAANEFPDLDVSIRGAVSIARRLQDPLAELVKIDPKSIGVGQYQHDVSQHHLAQSLDAVVEDCVNAVGVDVNSASVELLAHVSGLSRTLAQNIVVHRDGHGPFKNRTQLKKVERLGPKAFELCAGFLRINQGDNPLDSSAVHPEAYPVVRRITKHQNSDISGLIGNVEQLRQLQPSDYTDDNFGLPTVLDIFKELEKPGRDPRGQFKTALFKEGVNTLKDLEINMILEGVISNVTTFGAFVDIGVHQDGLVHISALADRFVKDPREIVKAGDVVKVKVLEVDLERKRIALSMRLNDEATTTPPQKMDSSQKTRQNPSRKDKGAKPAQQNAPLANNALAQAFAKAQKGR